MPGRFHYQNQWICFELAIADSLFMVATRNNQLTFLPCAYLYARPHARPRDASVGQVVKYGSYGSYMQLFPTNNMTHPFNVGVNFLKCYTSRRVFDSSLCRYIC